MPPAPVSSRVRYLRPALILGACAALTGVPAVASAAAADPVVSRILVGLQRDTAGLEALATSVSTPAGAAYGEYLPVATLARRYGASDATVAKVRRALAKAGHTHTLLDATRGFLILLATKRQVAEMDGDYAATSRGGPRGAAIARIRSGAGGMVTEIITQPLALTPAGVSDTARPALDGMSWPSRTGTPRGCTKGVSTPMPSAYLPEMAAAFPNSKVFTPNQFQLAFGMAPLHRVGVRGQGQHIALFEQAAGIKVADMATFAKCFGLPMPNLRVVPVGQSHPVEPQAGPATMEAHLDVQAVMMAAPRARITVVEGSPNASMPEIMSAALDARRMRGVPDVLSVSYGICEILLQRGWGAPFLSGAGARRLTDWVMATAAGAGVTVVVATGDSGAQSCAHEMGDNPAGPAANDAIALAATPYVGYPASSPWAIGVGATTMTLTRGNAIRTQRPWNDRVSIGRRPIIQKVIDGVPTVQFRAGAGTGGNSQLYGTPGYQVSAGIRSTRRLVPDVSMYGAWGVPVVCSVDDAVPGTGPCPKVGASWPYWSVAGTSFAAPLLAGAVALANQVAEARGAPRAGFMNPLLYASGRSAVTDVTRGNNDAFGTGRCCFAGPGYDQATGLGTVDASRLATALVRAGG